MVVRSLDIEKDPFMPRERDENLAGAEVPFLGANGALMGSTTRKSITNDDANMYLKEINEAFKNEKYKYNEYLRAMKDFQIKRIDIEGLMARVEKLFNGHKELLLKFNNFLPDGFEIKTPSKKPNIPIVKKEDVQKYLEKVKIRFSRQPIVYDMFLDIINMYKNKYKSLEEIYEMVISLFEDHPDLIDEFTEFLL
ncbi:paired amphipathic helix protein Sin3-like 2 [Vicia villosa]|uniref:paired amphipathic helix protein Sin3-like 2 n=1 Tax=Vicia villosa TaxID=3911 RepID=UPI00273B7849|nr:paired amphipathic helix protein Sin3-like 2 [Vicia villosa]